MALAADLLAATPAAEHKPRQRGVATLESRVERQRLNLRLEKPLDNLVGFDRAPRTAAERAVVERALAPLHDTEALVQVDGAAGCTLRASRIEALVPGLAPAGAVGSCVLQIAKIMAAGPWAEGALASYSVGAIPQAVHQGRDQQLRGRTRPRSALGVDSTRP